MPKRERAGLGVELAALREIGLALAEVVDFEKIGGALARGRGQDRRVEQHEAALVKELARGGGDLVAHAQDRVLARRAHPQMAQVEQKGDPVLLGRDRIVDRGCVDLKALDRQLEAAGRALVFAHHTGHLERGLLPQMVGGGERVGADFIEQGDALAYSGAVAQQQEVDFAARAAIVEPSLERDFLADVTAQFVDIDPRHGAI